jgi:hypothetical protein
MTNLRAGVGIVAVRAIVATTVVLGQGPVKSVTVPRGDGAPVITDGIFTPGEWDDALRIEVNDGVTLYLKEHRGVVFVGVRGHQANGIGPSELSLAGSDGIIRRLHVSAALTEAIVPPDGPVPSLRLGFTSDWYANEQRRDEALMARMKQEGKDPLSIMQATNYPSDGIEFAIRRSKVPGSAWRIRLRASAFSGGKPGVVTYPPEAAERTVDRWLELRFESPDPAGRTNSTRRSTPSACAPG